MQRQIRGGGSDALDGGREHRGARGGQAQYLLGQRARDREAALTSEVPAALCEAPVTPVTSTPPPLVRAALRGLEHEQRNVGRDSDGFEDVGQPSGVVRPIPQCGRQLRQGLARPVHAAQNGHIARVQGGQRAGCHGRPASGCGAGTAGRARALRRGRRCIGTRGAGSDGPPHRRSAVAGTSLPVDVDTLRALRVIRSVSGLARRRKRNIRGHSLTRLGPLSHTTVAGTDSRRCTGRWGGSQRHRWRERIAGRWVAATGRPEPVGCSGGSVWCSATAGTSFA
jgi:hypothetical protein